MNGLRRTLITSDIIVLLCSDENIDFINTYIVALFQIAITANRQI